MLIDRELRRSVVRKGGGNVRVQPQELMPESD